MSKIKSFFVKFAEVLGLKKQSKYVASYLHRANIRSGVFMAAVVAVLEMWLVIRQHQKYIIPTMQAPGNTVSYFRSLFDNTSLFWLQMVMGISMFLYCIAYLSEKRSKGFLIATLISSAIGIVLCALLPLENRIKNFNPKRLVDTVLLISLYSAILLFHASTIIASLTRYKGKKIEWLHSVLIITIFATCLLIFGIKVSYGDFTSTRTVNGVVVANPDYKEIICFLMMAIYVGCLLIWRPYISVAILGAIFLGFYFLLKSFDPNIRYFPDGDKVNYITFFISLAMVSVSIFSQRNIEAKKDEELEILATVDLLTGLMTYNYFLSESDKKASLEKPEANKYAFLFFNISSFKNFNDQRGYEAGNKFLKEVGQIIQNTFPGAYVSRQADDHFVAYVENKNLTEKFNTIREQVRKLDNDIKPNITIGYNVVIDEHEAKAGVEKARYANAYLKHIKKDDFYQYNQQLHDLYERNQYVVSHIDEAVEQGWIQAYYQPVVYSKDGTLCGAEALARWNDPKFGFWSPGMFIEPLENSRLAYKIDLALLEIVCKNMRKALDNNEQVLPTSINISRSDFSVIDVPEEIVKITKKYGISPEFLHIEITESALLDEQADLVDATSRIKKNGFALWLDDFGSGYSSFNTLKDFAFDVVKLDMEFLKGFGKNEKSKPVIDSVIKMAGSINMGTLCEGVETKEQAEFLKSIGCRRLQGYLISKPIPYEELKQKIAKKEFTISKEL